LLRGPGLQAGPVSKTHGGNSPRRTGAVTRKGAKRSGAALKALDGGGPTRLAHKATP